jgi:CRP-like cAMP-binding protein
MRMQDVIFDFLSRHTRMPAADMEGVMDLIIFKGCKKGELLLEEGKKTQDSYMVMKGCLRSFYTIDGLEKTTDFFLEQEIITPACSIDNSASKYSIAALEDAVLLVSNPDTEAEGFSRFPEFEALCRKMSERELIKKQEALDMFKISSPEERYLFLLQKHPELLQRVPQYYIASYLGIQPQSLSRLRKRIATEK